MIMSGQVTKAFEDRQSVSRETITLQIEQTFYNHRASLQIFRETPRQNGPVVLPDFKIGCVYNEERVIAFQRSILEFFD